MTSFNGHVDIYYASAGTGKTQTLINCVMRAMKEGYEPENIAFVTFTRAGAEVAQRRTAEATLCQLTRLSNFRTIHSMAFRGNKVAKDAMMDRTKYLEFGGKAGYDFTNYSTRSIVPIPWERRGDTHLINLEQLYRNNTPYAQKIMENRVSNADLVRYMQLYQKFKDTFGYKDFTDLLEDYIEDDVEEDVQVVCLDEMQDSSLLQWQMLLKAFAGADQLYVAGDIKQSIYTWAGAAPEVLLNLRGDVHYLDTSWRVPSTILDFVNKNIVSQMEMKDHTNAKSKNEGGKIEYLPTLESLDLYYDPSKTYFFLTRLRKYQEDYMNWCKERILPFIIDGKPCFNRTDKYEFREGLTEHWSKDKLIYATELHKKGLFYPEPNIRINTIHTVKGDEADVVVLLSDMDSKTCRSMEVDADAEHHVFYVACTRAKEALYIIEPRGKWNYPYLF